MHGFKLNKINIQKLEFFNEGSFTLIRFPVQKILPLELMMMI